MGLNFLNIFRAHRKTGHSIFFWGSAARGKTSIVKKTCIEEHMDIYVISASTLDPLTLLLPTVDKDTGVIQSHRCSWLDRCCKATADNPMCLFLDEINRVRSVQTLNLLTELILERKIDEHYLSPHCMIVAAGNLTNEDHGCIELPDAVWQRFTHILHAPDFHESMVNMRNSTAKEVLKINPKLLAPPRAIEFPLEASPRQIDAVCDLFDTGLLDMTDLGIVARGRVGIEAGNALTQALVALKDRREPKLPAKLEYKHFDRVKKHEEDGMIIEVSALLLNPENDRRVVADYLLQCAKPETVRSVHEKGFKFTYPNDVYATDKSGKAFVDPVSKKPLEHVGMQWQFYAMLMQKISSKRKQA